VSRVSAGSKGCITTAFIDIQLPYALAQDVDSPTGLRHQVYVKGRHLDVSRFLESKKTCKRRCSHWRVREHLGQLHGKS
jgi:hypothetical protein